MATFTAYPLALSGGIAYLFPLFCTPFYIMFIKHYRLIRLYAGTTMCADCGYILDTGGKKSDRNRPQCPECGGQYWFVMPERYWYDKHANSNMPRIWVSGKDATLTVVLSFVIMMVGSVSVLALPMSLTTWKAGSWEMTWALPMVIWIASVALAFWVAGMIRRRADDRRRQEHGSI
ncbi:MAG TPA: hypothetical protein ENJ00_10220 [Phycisphaerales bacterium]|nr:hypothetical protein [Phycisphaerales bacterium]